MRCKLNYIRSFYHPSPCCDEEACISRTEGCTSDSEGLLLVAPPMLDRLLVWELTKKFPSAGWDLLLSKVSGLGVRDTENTPFRYDNGEGIIETKTW